MILYMLFYVHVYVQYNTLNINFHVILYTIVKC